MSAVDLSSADYCDTSVEIPCKEGGFILFVSAQGHPATNEQWLSVYIISSERFQEVGPISIIFMGEYRYRVILICVRYRHILRKTFPSCSKMPWVE